MSLAMLNELKQDLEEYEQLQKTAQRPKVQEALLKEVDRLRRETLALEKKLSAQPQQAGVEGACGLGGGDHVQSYTENITNYGFDQSDKFMQLYLTLDNLGSISDDKIVTDFSNRSVTVKVQFPNKTSQLHIARLSEEIVPKDSYVKKKTKYVLVMLKKAETGKHWSSLTEQEKKSKEKKKPKFDENEDPGVSLNNMLKNMYEEGDDEMKRTISKAFYESQRKQRGEPDSFADL